MIFFRSFVEFSRAIRKGMRNRELQGLWWFVIFILAIGTAFYHTFEGWSVLDSLYFSVTTLATVGFGDVTPITDAGKVFTIIYIIVGVGILLSFINGVAQEAQSQNPMRQLLELDQEDKEETAQ